MRCFVAARLKTTRRAAAFAATGWLSARHAGSEESVAIDKLPFNLQTSPIGVSETATISPPMHENHLGVVWLSQPPELALATIDHPTPGPLWLGRAGGKPTPGLCLDFLDQPGSLLWSNPGLTSGSLGQFELSRQQVEAVLNPRANQLEVTPPASGSGAPSFVFDPGFRLLSTLDGIELLDERGRATAEGRELGLPGLVGVDAADFSALSGRLVYGADPLALTLTLDTRLMDAAWNGKPFEPTYFDLGLDLPLLRAGMKAVPEVGTARGAFASRPERCRFFAETGTATIAKPHGGNEAPERRVDAPTDRTRTRHVKRWRLADGDRIVVGPVSIEVERPAPGELVLTASKQRAVWTDNGLDTGQQVWVECPEDPHPLRRELQPWMAADKERRLFSIGGAVDCASRSALSGIPSRGLLVRWHSSARARSAQPM